MDTVAFITTETGDDLIVSFAVQDPRDPTAVESLTLIRTPKYEFIFDEHDRGVSVSFDRNDEVEDAFLQEVDYLEAQSVVRVKTSSRQYELDVRKVAAKELKRMRQVLHKMNYDKRFRTLGV